MAGRITEADKEQVRAANRIDQVIGEYVALRSAGGGNLKGLCPFHDEKTPSFVVNPGRGRYHCYGCNQGGDVFEFVAGMEHLNFTEAVQRLADRSGITLTLVEGGTSTSIDRGSRSRLIAANKAAAEFYAGEMRTEGAKAARDYLAERGFDSSAAAHFGCGFAPAAWDGLVKALTAQGFTLDELAKAGLAKEGSRGWIDQFHRRLLWAIRDASGDVVGFGARRLFDDDRLEAKYVNTAERPLFKKSQLLYGLDLAKKEIARTRQVVVVEGYTDVMAMHLAGVTTAVASCGTAFGDDHISVLRRYLRDSETIRGEVVYTFDGDSAGQKAALKAFDSDQKFAANTFVAVAPDGMDPCELRQARGDGAVRELVAGRRPLFKFAVQQALASFDLDSVEGRVGAANAAIPMVARIKEPELRAGYARELAGLLGADHVRVLAMVRAQSDADRKSAAAAERRLAQAVPVASGGAGGPVEQPFRRPNPADPATFAQREALKLALQQPGLLFGVYADIEPEAFSDSAYAALHMAVSAAGGPQRAAEAGAVPWVASVREHLPAGGLRSLFNELAVEPVALRLEPDAAYAGAIVARLAERLAASKERGLRSDLQRAEAAGDSERAAELNADLMALAAYRRALADRASKGAG